ncbi:30S ribosomal protein S5 [Mycoplasma sp. 1578d]|nr:MULTISPECIES: 30S ribosomal protein S5 [unclassified Mycoplasma]UUM19973.1 30S ribosomal protein S5 [Mycoplasma sp. 1578d]UUM24954.1 30S ribosomal protein S5 [Mycoplasma sp. 3686d]
MENQKQATKPVVGTKEVKSPHPRPAKPATPPVEERRNFRNPKTKTDKRPNRDDRPRRTRGFEQPVSEYSEKVIDIARVTKVVKGGRRFSFSAFVVVGNKKGSVGLGHGKANEVPDAIKKAIKDAQNNLIDVPLVNGTVPHEIQAKFLASRVMLKPASKGKGLIASGTVRAVTELAGYTDIVTKTYGSRSKANTVKATLKALSQLRTVEQIAEIRNKDVKDLI